VDTGAAHSLLSESVARILKLKIQPLQEHDYSDLTAANGSKVELIGTVDLRLYIKGLIIYKTVRIAKQLFPRMLLGVDFLATNKATVTYRTGNGILSLYDDVINLPMHSQLDEINCVTVPRTLCIPAFTEAYLTVNCPKHVNNTTVLLENVQRPTPIVVAKALTSCKDNKTVCRVLNANPYVIRLKKGFKLAKIAHLDCIASIHECKKSEMTELQEHTEINVSETELDDFHKPYGFQITPALPEDRRYEVLRVLYRYKSVFARDLTEIQECTGPPLKLDLHTDRKMFKRQYRLNDADKVEVARQIQVMQQANVIEPSDSSYYNSPTYLVAKKNGSKRLVIDLRVINNLVIPKLVQLPQIEELLDEITAKEPTIFSVMDIFSVFYNIPLSEESRDLTTFTAPDGRRFKYRRCPFGLNNAPSQLSVILGNLFSDKSRFHSLACYAGDLAIYSCDWKSHLQQLELMLRTLQDVRLSRNPRKTEIGASEIEYLGYRLSGDSVRMSKKRIQVINDISTPIVGHPPSNCGSENREK